MSPPSEARFTILGLAPTDVAVASKPVSGTSYRLGEEIEVAVTFGDRVLVETSQGTPTLALTVGAQTRQVSYVRGTGTTQLVFAYTVVAADSDTDGIAVAADALALNGGAITNAYGVPALLDHDAVAAQSGHGADGSQTPGFSLTGGVCGRTGQVRDKLVDLVNDVAANSAVTNCSLVTEAHLGALTGTLDLSSASIAALKAGDFAGLGGITTLNLDSNALPTLPARVFEPLTGLTTLTLAGNPGAAGFAPQAVSGPSGGFDAVSGGSVTLGVEGAAAGQDDPWGSNVTYAWSLTEGTGGTLTAETAARAGFTAPVTAEDETHTVRLTVTGAGGSFVGTDDATVRVAAGPKVERVSFATLALSAGGPAYTADGVVSVTLGFDRAVTVATADGTPSVSLTVGTATKTAGYLSGTGTRSLTFGYTVVAADTDTDGVDMAADSLALNGGRITGVSDGGDAALGHAGLAGSSERPVNGSGAPVVSGGICGRTAAVQAAVLARVRTAEDDATLACGAVTPAMLTAIAGRLDMSAQVAAHGRMTALKAGDFAWLANVTALDLDRHALRSFPGGVFDGLVALQELSVAYNQTQAADRMTTLPAGLFDRLTKLTTLRLEHNDLETLPDGIFERLTRLTTLTLDGNPGSASFLPVAVAGPAGGFDAEAGDLVTLGGAPGGLWGGNLVHAWRQVAGPTEALSASNVAAPSFTAPALGRAVALEYELMATGRGTLRTATDSVTVRVAPSAVVASLAAVSGPVSGDTYRRGETIGIAVTFGKPVVVTGTPQLALSVGTATRQAAYARGTGTTQLVFEYTVLEADRDPDGIAVAANALALNNGTITDADAGGAAADLGHDALTAQSGHKVDGSLAGLTGGICGRTPEVRDALLLRVRTVNAGLSCAQVTTTHLGALTGTLSLPGRGIRALRPGDFAGLTNVTALDLGGNEMTSLPAGVFAGLDDTLTRLDLSDNDLVSLSAGLFGPLTGLTALDLSDNDLAALPTRLFEKLTGLTALTLSGNPGSARFRPVARAGPEGGIDVVQGATVTLGVAGAEDGFDDPWGTNVTWAWTRTAGTSVTLTNGTTARPEFTAPSADETLTFTLMVTGKGGITATDTVSVRVGTAGMRPMPKSAAVNGETLTLTYDEVLQTASPASATGKGPVYLAVVGGPGAQRSIKTARLTAVKASGRTVTITLDPPAEYNEAVTLSYYPDNATADSSVRDRGGNLANGFTGFQVRNDTPEGPHVDDIAFAGAGKTYGIGDTVEIDVTFSEAVTVTGRPTLGLDVGVKSRKVGYVSGSGSAVLRFEYTVVPGDLDSDGLAVKANGLEAPSDSSIVTVAQTEAVILRHGSFSDPAHKVDGVLPKATAASVAGPTVTVTWSEALDEAAVPTGAGGFTVRIATANGPAVTAVAVSGSTTVLSLASAIADGTQNVTLEYAPPSSGAKIRDAVGNDAAAILRADPLAVEVTPDTRAPEVLDAPTVDGDALAVTFDEALDAASVPAAPGGFTVTVTRGSSTVSGHTVSALSLSSSDTVLTLTLALAVRSGDLVTLAYAKPSTPLRDQATTPNEVADFTTGSGDVLAVENRTPSVKTVAFAGAAQTYAIDDRVALEVTFTQAVAVTTTPTARPELSIEVGANTRKALYVSGTGSATLRFEYAIVAGDEDGDGVAIPAAALSTPFGSSIVTVAGSRTVQFAHDAVAADPAHKVDGVLPTADAASSAGPTVTVTWSEALDEAAVPTGAGGFTVRIATANGPAVTAVAVSGSETVLSLASAIADGTQSVTLEYAPPGTGAKIRDAAGNDAAAILRADPLDVTVTPDTRAPEVLGTPTVDGDALAVTFDEALDAASVPAAPGGFTVTVTRGGSTVSGHTVSHLSLSSTGTVLTLTLAQAVRNGDVVVLAYAKPSTPLRDRATPPNDVADFTTGSGDVLAIENRTPSVKTVAFAGAAQTYAIGGSVAVEVTFTQAVAVAIPTARPELSIEVGANTRKALYVSGTGSATLRFEYAIVAGDEDNDGIAIPADSLSTPFGSSIVTLPNFRRVQFGHDAVAADPAHKVDGVLPTADTAAVAGPTVTVTWSEALDEAAVPTGAGGFTVRIATANGPAVTAVAVSGSTTVLSLASAIADGTQNVTLEYAPPGTGAKIRDAVGNDAAAILRTDPLDVTVTPDTRAPEVSGAPTVDGATLAITFDEALDAASISAAPGGFTVTVTRDSSTVSGHTVSALSLSSTGTVLTLTLAQGVLADDLVTLAYAKPSTPLRDQATTPNDVADFTTGSGDVPAVINGTGALELALSKATAVEGDDATVTLTVAVEGSGTSGAARVIAVAASGTPTATQTGDWTLQSGTGTLETGAKSVAFPITIIDDARLEAQETVTFAVTADGAEIGTVTLTIDDDDRAVLAVVGPDSHVTEDGEVFTIKLRLDPHPDNGPPVADDACFLDFPVTAILSVAGGASELTDTPTLPGEYTFAATAFDDCTREVPVDLETRASDGNWTGDRAVSFALARNSGQDARIDPGEAQVTVRDDTPPPGPLVEKVDMPAAPSGAAELTGPFFTRKAFYDREEVPDDAVHGAGARLTFTLTFDEPVTVEDGSPELVLDVWKRARRARLTTPTEQLSDTNTLTFAWTVAKGDNDPDGIRIAGLDLKEARIRFAAGCQQDPITNIDLPCDIDLPTFAARYGKTYPEHRVRGGLHSIALEVSGGAREGQPFEFAATRDGGYGEEAYAIVTIIDSVFEEYDPVLKKCTEERVLEVFHRRVDFAAGQRQDDGVARTTAQLTPQGYDAADPNCDERWLTVNIGTTEVGIFAPACVFVGDSETCTQWYDTPEGEDGTPVTFAVAVADTGLAAGTPSLAVRDAYGGGVQEPSQEQVDSGTDAPLSFHVMLSKTSNSAVTVDYTTRDGTATGGADYVAASGTLTFEPGETVKTVEVRVLPDSHDEGSETMSLVLSNAGGAAIDDAEGIGTIFNTGPIPRAWIARFGRTVAEQMLEAVEGRMRASPAPGVEIAFAGQQIGVGSGSPGSGSGAGGSEAEREARRDAQRLTDWLNSETDGEVQYDSRAVTSRDLLTGSSFTLTEETPGKDMVSFWGRGVVTTFDGREGDLTLDGEVATGMFGADWRRGRWTTGLILSHSSGEGGYSDGSGSPGSGSGAGGAGGTDTDAGAGGSVEATLTGLFPWTRHALSDRLEAWGVAGYGAGDLTVTPKKPGTEEGGAVIRADLDLRMAAVGLRGTLLDGGSGSPGSGSGAGGAGGAGGGFWGGLTLTGKTDAMVVQTASGQGRGADGGNLEAARATVTRLRLGVEASRPLQLGGGGTVLTPSLEVGVRHDGGDAETGFGLDLGIGLALSDPERGLQAEMRGRGLLAHESEGFRDLGFSGSFAWEGKPGSGLGAKLGLTQTVGGSSSGGADALLSRTTMDGLAANPGSGSGAGGAGDSDDDLMSRRLDLKFGYGLPAFGGRFTWTPEVGASLSDTGRDYSLGWRLVRGGSGEGGGSIEISFDARRSESANDDTQPVHEVGLRFTARF